MIIGVAKGGFGGVGTVIAVPVMALTSPPAETLGVLLPVLMLADVIAVSSHRRSFDASMIRHALPGAVVGVIAGGFLLAVIDGAPIRIAIGLLSIVFALNAMRGSHAVAPSAWADNPRFAPVVGVAAGLTSTLAHAGGPPIHMHLLARGLSPVVFVATASVFMASLNLMKVVPYLLLGNVDGGTLSFSLALLPVVGAAAFFGVWLSRRIERRTFSRVMNGSMLVIGLKLVHDGVAAL